MTKIEEIGMLSAANAGIHYNIFIQTTSIYDMDLASIRSDLLFHWLKPSCMWWHDACNLFYRLCFEKAGDPNPVYCMTK